MTGTAVLTPCCAEDVGGNLLSALGDLIGAQATATSAAYRQRTRHFLRLVRLHEAARSYHDLKSRGYSGLTPYWEMPYADLITWSTDQLKPQPTLPPTHAQDLHARLHAALSIRR